MRRCSRPHDLRKERIDWLIPHQANLRIIEATARKLGLPMDKVVVTVDRHANTSAASIPLALDEAVRDGRIRRGQHVLLEAVGGGFTWGAVPDQVELSEIRHERFAFVFPGQGSQSVGMMAPLRIAARSARRPSRRPVRSSGRICGSWSRGGPGEELNKTVNTQPAMLTAGYALLRAWQAAGGPEPALLAGHSLGEYAALVAGGVLELAGRRCRSCAIGRKRCRKQCPRVRAGSLRFWGWTRRACARCVPRQRRARCWRRPTSMPPSQVVIAGHRQAVRARRSSSPRPGGPNVRCCCR